MGHTRFILTIGFPRGGCCCLQRQVSWVRGYKALLLQRLVSRPVTLTLPANMVRTQNIRSHHKPHRSELGSLCLQGTSLSTRNFEIGHLKGPGGELGQAIGINVTEIGAGDVVRGYSAGPVLQGCGFDTPPPPSALQNKDMRRRNIRSRNRWWGGRLKTKPLVWLRSLPFLSHMCLLDQYLVICKET